MDDGLVAVYTLLWISWVLLVFTIVRAHMINSVIGPKILANPRKALQKFRTNRMIVTLLYSGLVLTTVAVFGVFWGGPEDMPHGMCVTQAIFINLAYLFACGTATATIILYYRKLHKLINDPSADIPQDEFERRVAACLIFGMSATLFLSGTEDFEPQSTWCWVRSPDWVKLAGLYVIVAIMTVVGVLFMTITIYGLYLMYQRGPQGSDEQKKRRRQDFLEGGKKLVIFLVVFLALNLAAFSDRLHLITRDEWETSKSSPRVTEYACALMGIILFGMYGFRKVFIIPGALQSELNKLDPRASMTPTPGKKTRTHVRGQSEQVRNTHSTPTSDRSRGFIGTRE